MRKSKYIYRVKIRGGTVYFGIAESVQSACIKAILLSENEYGVEQGLHEVESVEQIGMVEFK